jgi:hypothetical protein
MIIDLICEQFPHISRDEILASLRAIDVSKVKFHRQDPDARRLTLRGIPA